MELQKKKRKLLYMKISINQDLLILWHILSTVLYKLQGILRSFETQCTAHTHNLVKKLHILKMKHLNIEYTQ